MKRVLTAVLVAAAGVVRAGAEPLTVVASLLPQSAVVERVGGNHVSVMVLVEQGQEPHGFRPSAKKVTDLTKAAVWFSSGMRFEDPLTKMLESKPGGPRRVSLGAEALGAGGLESHCETNAEHGTRKAEKGEGNVKRGTRNSKLETEKASVEHVHHDEGSWDPHVWTAPLLVGRQARLVAAALREVDAAHAAEYDARAAELEGEAQTVHAELTEKLALLKGSAFYVFHPAFGYFAEAYGLKQVPIENGGREPSAKHLTKLIEQARQDRVKLILLQPQQPSRGAERVAQAIGAQAVELDPLAKDVFGTMRSLAELLLKARP